MSAKIVPAPPACMSREAINARIELVAFERGLSRTEISAAKSSYRALVDFADRYDLSVDWLVCGDLGGRLRMAHWYRNGSTRWRSTNWRQTRLTACDAEPRWRRRGLFFLVCGKWRRPSEFLTDLSLTIAGFRT
jgi:hypothetical protein